MDQSKGKKYIYSGWIVDELNQTAVLKPMQHKDPLAEVRLIHSEIDSTFHGWWPKPPSFTPQTIITGICIWDGRWTIEFARQRRKDMPAMRRLSMKHDRDDALRRIKESQRILRITYPTTLGQYHYRLIKWLAAQVKPWNPHQIYYNVPLDEYHGHISEVENALGRKLDVLHDSLDQFGLLVKCEIKKQFGELASKIQFIRPMKQWGCQTAVSSFVEPFFRLSELCHDPSKAVAVQELSENYAVREFQKASGITIPNLCSVLGNPSPFRSKSLTLGEFLEIRMS